MLVIRLQRVGKKHQPSYRVVVAERRSKLGGPPVEDLGSYNPFTKKGGFANDRIRHWLKTGAKATPTVHNILVKNGVLTGPKMKVYVKKNADAGTAQAPRVSAETDSALQPDSEQANPPHADSTTETESA